ncbi:MAG: class I SAM-dependent methyltransferase [Pseudomonadota bacterium]
MTDAPFEYVREYYAMDVARWDGFPDVTSFMDRFLGNVTGKTVLNPGCGPQFYDWLLRFGEVPERYVGVDYGPATVDYLNTATDPRFLEAKEAAMRLQTECEVYCADILEWLPQHQNSFDCIIATGFVGTFHDQGLDQLLAAFRQSLRPGGRFVKMTWHGPHRTPEQTQKKLEYGYDSPDEHNPDAYLTQIERAGFQADLQEIFECDPTTYRWDVVQGCVFSVAQS